MKVVVALGITECRCANEIPHIKRTTRAQQGSRFGAHCFVQGMVGKEWGELEVGATSPGLIGTPSESANGKC